MSNILQQINLSYSNKEDRLLLKTTTVDGDEYKIWLTRRFTKILFDILKKSVGYYTPSITNLNQSIVNKTNQQSINQDVNGDIFNQSLQEDNIKQLDGYEILAHKIKCGNDDKNNTVLEFQSEDGKGITYSLNESLLSVFYSLIIKSTKLADWDIISSEENIESVSIH